VRIADEKLFGERNCLSKKTAKLQLGSDVSGSSIVVLVLCPLAVAYRLKDSLEPESQFSEYPLHIRSILHLLLDDNRKIFTFR
jgi:hypothetical protein